SRAPCYEAADEIAAQAKLVKVSKLVKELASAAKSSPPPSAKPDADAFDAAAWKAATGESGWERRTLAGVREGLRNLKNKDKREVVATRTDKALLRAWNKIADKTLAKAAAEFRKLAADKDDKPAETRGRRAHVASR